MWISYTQLWIINVTRDMVDGGDKWREKEYG
jgi:hypothetical protein